MIIAGAAATLADFIESLTFLSEPDCIIVLAELLAADELVVEVLEI